MTMFVTTACSHAPPPQTTHPETPVAPHNRNGGTESEPTACPYSHKYGPNGCPTDGDGDGVVDHLDACPDAPGIEPEGCPTDGDGDGIIDHLDTCPSAPGIEPEGCPIPDTDGDGILDIDDQCVSEPETMNGFDDSDGCPDEIPPSATHCYPGRVPGIYFGRKYKPASWNTSEAARAAISSAVDTTSGGTQRKRLQRAARIPNKAVPVLARAGVILNEFPGIVIEISGHTDNREGRDEREREVIGLARAQVVRAYLIDVHGIEPTRIHTRTAGSSQPIDDNSTTPGREHNRRVDFKVLTQ